MITLENVLTELKSNSIEEVTGGCYYYKGTEQQQILIYDPGDPDNPDDDLVYLETVDVEVTYWYCDGSCTCD